MARITGAFYWPGCSAIKLRQKERLIRYLTFDCFVVKLAFFVAFCFDPTMREWFLLTIMKYNKTTHFLLAGLWCNQIEAEKKVNPLSNFWMFCHEISFFVAFWPQNCVGDFFLTIIKYNKTTLFISKVVVQSNWGRKKG